MNSSIKAILQISLMVSLLTNAWYWRTAVTHRTGDLVRPGAMRPRQVAARTSLSEVIVRLGGDAGIAAVLAGENENILRDQLRSAGADDETIRAALDGVSRRRSAVQASAERRERIRSAWWRPAQAKAPGRPGPQADRVRESMGPDPLDLADAELRYQFLPADKRRLLAQIDLDYADLLRAQPGAGTRADLDEYALINRERQQDILAALSPDERAEYDLRFGESTSSITTRFAAMAASESEFRAIKPLADELQRGLKILNATDPDYRNRRLALEQATLDGLVEKIGYDRTLDYLWSTTSNAYVGTLEVLQANGLPSHRAAQLLQLGTETGIKGREIHENPALSADEKRAALAALQESVRPQLGTLVPVELQTKLPSEAIAWFGALAEGRYAELRPDVGTTAWYAATPQPVWLPRRAPATPIALPRRHGN